MKTRVVKYDHQGEIKWVAQVYNEKWVAEIMISLFWCCVFLPIGFYAWRHRQKEHMRWQNIHKRVVNEWDAIVFWGLEDFKEGEVATHTERKPYYVSDYKTAVDIVDLYVSQQRKKQELIRRREHIQYIKSRKPIVLEKINIPHRDETT